MAKVGIVINKVNKYNSNYINQMGDMDVEPKLSREAIYQIFSSEIDPEVFNYFCDILESQGITIEEFYARQEAIVDQRLDSIEMSESMIEKLRERELKIVKDAIVTMANHLKFVSSETWVQVQEILDSSLKDDLEEEEK